MYHFIIAARQVKGFKYTVPIGRCACDQCTSFSIQLEYTNNPESPILTDSTPFSKNKLADTFIIGFKRPCDQQNLPCPSLLLLSGGQLPVPNCLESNLPVRANPRPAQFHFCSREHLVQSPSLPAPYSLGTNELIRNKHRAPWSSRIFRRLACGCVPMSLAPFA
jgi:hypothetical protein